MPGHLWHSLRAANLLWLGCSSAVGSRGPSICTVFGSLHGSDLVAVPGGIVFQGSGVVTELSSMNLHFFTYFTGLIIKPWLDGVTTQFTKSLPREISIYYGE